VFTAVDALIQSGHAMPAETRGIMAVGLGLAGFPEARAAAVSVPARSGFGGAPRGRRSAGAGRRSADADGTPAADRHAQLAARERTCGNRRDHPQARAAGVDCAPWEAGSVEDIVATSIDGARRKASC